MIESFNCLQHAGETIREHDPRPTRQERVVVIGGVGYYRNGWEIRRGKIIRESRNPRLDVSLGDPVEVIRDRHSRVVVAERPDLMRPCPLRMHAATQKRVQHKRVLNGTAGPALRGDHGILAHPDRKLQMKGMAVHLV
jgi:hypothetical protein